MSLRVCSLDEKRFLRYDIQIQDLLRPVNYLFVGYNSMTDLITCIMYSKCVSLRTALVRWMCFGMKNQAVALE